MIDNVQIASEKYNISFIYDNDNYMIFYKNDEDMKIENFYKIGISSSGASYNRYISVDDFAKIMEMEVERVDTTTGVVYLTMKS